MFAGPSRCPGDAEEEAEATGEGRNGQGLPRQRHTERKKRKKGIVKEFFFGGGTTPSRSSHATRRGAMACNTEGTTVSEVAAVVNSLSRAGVSREMRDSSTVGMGWA
jgi:hypothetical protein